MRRDAPQEKTVPRSTGTFPNRQKSRAMTVKRNNHFEVWEEQVEVPSDLERVL